MDNNKYRFTLNNFDGPLDLLLYLIKDKKINIFDINLLELAQQYLNYISKKENPDLEIASEYLVMAATLIQIKSKALLENPKDKEELEVDKYELLKQLAEYQQFKQIKNKLRKNELIRKNIFTKKPDDLKEFIRPTDPTQLDGHSDPVKLIMTLRKMFERTYAQKISVGTIDAFQLSPEERTEEIRIMLSTATQLKFEDVFAVPSIKHFLVTLVALLDMSRNQEITLEQDHPFGKISILKGVKHE